MPARFGQLPPYLIDNAMINFQPVNSALDSYRAGMKEAGVSTAQINAANAMQAGDYERAASETARSGDVAGAMALRRHPLELQNLQGNLRDRETRRIAGQLQPLTSMPDGPERARAFRTWLDADPRHRPGIVAMGLDPDSPDIHMTAPPRILSEALGPAAPTFGPIGADRNGAPQYGFIDSRARRVTPSSAAGARDTGPDATAGLTGDAYLATLTPERAAQIKAIVEGRIPPLQPRQLATPMGQSILGDVMRYQPGFDATQWGARYRTAQDFSPGGRVGQNIGSLNTVLNHLSTTYDKIDALDNMTTLPILNAPRNAVRGQTDTGYQDARASFETARQTAVTEVAKALRGAGAMNEHELREWERKFNSNSSPVEMRAAIRQALELLEGRFKPLVDQYNSTMGTNRTVESFMSPSAVEHMDRLMGRPPRDTRRVVGQDNRGPAAGTREAPVLVDTPEQALRYRPGTWVRSPDGNAYMVPER